MANMFGPEGELLSPENEAEQLYNKRILALAAARKGIFVPTGDAEFDVELRKRIQQKKDEEVQKGREEDTHRRNIENIRGGRALQTRKGNEAPEGFGPPGPLAHSAREIDHRAAELGVDPGFYLKYGEEDSKIEAQRLREEAERKARVEALAIARARKSQFDNANNPLVPAHEKIGFEPSEDEAHALSEDIANRNRGSEIAARGGAFAILHPTIDVGEEKDVDVTNPFTGQRSRAKDASVGSGAILPGAMASADVDDEGNVTFANPETQGFASKVRAVAKARKEAARRKAEEEKTRREIDEALQREHELAVAKARGGVAQ